MVLSIPGFVIIAFIASASGEQAGITAHVVEKDSLQLNGRRLWKRLKGSVCM